MSLSLKKPTTKDLDFVLSLAQNGARHGHFDSRILTEKNAYRSYLSSAISKEQDLRGYPTHVSVVNFNDIRIGATIVTSAIGTPDGGVEIAMIALKGQYRGKGFGSQVLDALLDQNLSRGSVYVRCLPASHKLHQMMLRRGFTEVGTSQNSVILRHEATASPLNDISALRFDNIQWGSPLAQSPV